MENREERLFRALGDVGSDLIDTAEHKKFPVSPWRRFLPVAACAAILVTAALVLLPCLKDLEQTPATTSPQDSVTDATEQPGTEEEVLPEEDTGPAVPKERLTIGNTVYYREGFYTAKAAKELLGNAMGTVTAADDPELEGAQVYARKDCTWKNKMPLEVFVQYQEGYVYCLTYFAGDKPLSGLQDVEQWRQILAQAEVPADCLNLTFDQARELNSRELYDFFLLTLTLEQAVGQRSEDLNRYLWYRSDRKAYVIPKQDVTRQISRYLHDYVFVPSDCQGYDPALEAICVKTLLPEGETEHLLLEKGTTYDAQTGSLNLQVRTSETNRMLEYRLHFTPEDCVFLGIREITDVVHPIAEAESRNNETESPEEE